MYMTCQRSGWEMCCDWSGSLASGATKLRTCGAPPDTQPNTNTHTQFNKCLWVCVDVVNKRNAIPCLHWLNPSRWCPHRWMKMEPSSEVDRRAPHKIRDALYALCPAEPIKPEIHATKEMRITSHIKEDHSSFLLQKGRYFLCRWQTCKYSTDLLEQRKTETLKYVITTVKIKI